jgi:hypothetical protein
MGIVEGPKSTCRMQVGYVQPAFMRALLVVGADANDQIIKQRRRAINAVEIVRTGLGRKLVDRNCDSATA